MMKNFQILILFLLIFVASLSETYSQCAPNTLAFVGGQPIYNFACGNSSYQNINGSSPSGSGQTYKWEVSFSGRTYKTIVDGSNVPVNSIDLPKKDITDYVLTPNLDSSGDYRIRRIVTDTSPNCSNTSEPVFLYYAQSSASVSGGTITGNATTCSPASGTLTVAGHTGPVLQWESAPVSTGPWTPVNNITNTFSYSSLTTSTCYRALIDNICEGVAGSIDILDKYSTMFCVTVNSIPVVSDPVSQAVCLGSPFTLSVIATSVLAPTYQWRKNGINISGAVSSIFTVTNVGSTDAGSYDVIVSNACGSATSNPAVVTVNPIPIVTIPSNSTVCPGTTVSATNFTSSPSGASYTWTNSNTAIGLAASGIGNVPGFTATNSTTATISATITVTPTLNGCVGQSSIYTITVNPLVTVTVPANSTLCSGATVPSSNFSSIPPGATYTWTNSNTAIGLAVSGSGNVPSFTAANSTASPISASITVTPTINGCTGTASTYTITINPLPAIISATRTNETVCGANDGTITISATGSAPLEYSVNGGSTFVQNGGNFTGLVAGSYSVVVRNSSGCIFTGPTLSVASPGAPPAPTINPYTNPICAGTTMILSVENYDPSATYNWTGPFGFTATGTTVSRPNADPSMSGNYAVTASIGTCVSTSTIFQITVSPIPVVTVPANLTYCAGIQIPAGYLISTPAGSTYTWTNSNPAIGLAASGSEDIPTFTAANLTTSAISATITVIPSLNGCQGQPVSYTITVNPLPLVTLPGNLTFCPGATIPASNFTSTPAGATYTWTITGLGLAVSGNGNIPAFTATNSTTAPITGTVTVTPSINGCTGPSVSYTITVNPLPIVSLPSNSTVCPGATVSATNFTSSPSGASYTWTNSNTAIGLAASGSGNVPGFTATNTTTATISATITVTPTLNGCTGAASSYTILVNALTTVTVPANSSVCSGATVPSSNFSSVPPGATYTWTNSNTAIGLAASGSGNVPSFTAVNSTTSPISASITVTPTINGCTGTASTYTITVNPLPAIISATRTNETVCGVGDGTITINATGSAPLEYSINGGSTFVQNGGNFTGLAAGSYSIVVRNSTGCIFMGPTLSIASPGAPPAPTINPYTNPICAGTTMILSVENYDPSATYNWTGPFGFTATGATVSRPNADPSMSGNYAVTASIGTCVSASTIFQITVSPIPVVTVPANLTYCAGIQIPAGYLISTPAGSTYTWTNSNTDIGLAASGSEDIPTFTAANLTTSAISATITVTPTLNGCQGQPVSYTITVNPLPLVTLPGNLTFCHGATIPASNFTSTPAGATYTWIISGLGLTVSGNGNIPAFTATNSTTAPITGTVTVTPSINGCTGPSASYTITVNPPPIVTIPANSTVCPGATVLATNFTSTPSGANYTWTNSNTAIGLAASGSGNVPGFTATNSTTATISATITVTPTLNGCTGAASSYTILVNALTTVTVPANLSVCSGATVPSSNFSSIPPGATYTWTNSNTAIGLAVSGSGNVPSFTAVNNTTSPILASITVTPTVDGCTGTASTYTITVNPLPAIISATRTNETVCGVGDGTITISATGSAPLEYSINGGSTFVQNGGNFTGLAAGSYSLVVRNSTGCIVVGPTLSIASPNPPPQPIVYPTGNTVCAGSDLTFTVTNPQPGAIYTWKGPSGYFYSGPETSRTITNITTTMAGEYGVTATISECVSFASTFQVSVNPLPVVTVPASLTYCAGTSIPASNFTSTPSGATYTWTNSNPVIGLAAGGSGDVPLFTASNSTTSTISATITVTPSLNGCQGQPVTYTITVKPLPTAVISGSTTVCYGGIATLTVNLTGTAPWSITYTDGVTPLTINGISTSTYTFNVTSFSTKTYRIITVADGTSCPNTGSGNATVNQPVAALSAGVVSTNLSCFGANDATILIINVTGGFGAYEYSINGGISWQSGASFNGLTAGTYHVQVRDAASPSCLFVVNASLQISQPAILRATLVSTNVSCLGAKNGTITFNSPAGGYGRYEYSINGGISWQSGASFSNLAPGVYKVQMRDAANATCLVTVNASLQITEPQETLSAKISSQANVNCFGGANGTVDLTVSGGTTPYRYLWSNGSAGEDLTGVASGTYTVTVTDANNCTVTQSVTISQPAVPLSLTFTKTDVTCFGGNTGSIRLTITGGTVPYTYKWSNGQIAKDLNGVSATLYMVTVTDSKGCVISENITINQPAEALSLRFTKIDVRCFGERNGSINIAVTGGVAPYAYTWSNGKITEDLSDLAPNSYTLTVIDANGCSINQTISITQPAAQLKTSLTVKHTVCKTSNDGMITAIITGGKQPYSIAWRGQSQTTNVISNLAPGMYEVLVTDANGCTFTVSAEVMAGNCPPVAVNDRFITDEEVAVSGSVAPNDFDRQNEAISFTMTSQVKNGRIIFTNDGKFTYTPNVGFWGTETFTYRVCNTSGSCSVATAAIDVIPYTVVSLTPETSNVREGKKALVTARLMRPFKDDVIIRISYTGRAVKDRDYVLLDQFYEIRIPKGKVSTSEKITIAALTDDQQEGDEDVILQISASSDTLVRIGNGAVVVINDVYPPPSPPGPANSEIPPNLDILIDPLTSPNGDGQGNEFFKIENIVSFPDNEVIIFNRWGNEVFRLKGYNESDRVFKGFANKGLMTSTSSPLADGVYYYLITTNRIVNGQGISSLNKGYLILKR